MVSAEPKTENLLRAALGQCRKAAWVLVAFGFAINLLYLVAPLYMIQVFDRVLSSHRVETLFMLTLLAGFALLILGVLEAVRSRIQTRMSNWLDKTLSGEMIRASVGAALAGYSANAQAIRDLGSIRSFISGALRVLLDVPWAPIFILALWVLHPWLGLLGSACALILLFLAIVNEMVSKKLAQEANNARVSNENMVEQAIRNADVLRAMGMLNRLVENWDRRNQDVLADNLRAGDRNSVLFGLTRFARLFAQVGILGFGAYFVIRGELTPGGMIAGSILLTRALAPIEQLMGAWRNFGVAANAHKRLSVLVENMAEGEQPMRLPKPKGVLACEDMWFAPRPGMEPILKGIDMKLDAGEALALMGPSASGKTSLCKVIVGSWSPSKGHVRLDGTDIHLWESDCIGPNLGYLPQDVELFAVTVKENIARLDPDPNPEDVVAAAKAAGVHDMILGLPEGYDTLIGPGGAFLSGGQRQRVGLARAFYGQGGDHPRLIVLDEPNSNLDTRGDQALMQAIETAKTWGSTVVLVTHNMRLLRPMDKIMVLNDGQQAMFGPRDDVLMAMRPKSVAAEGSGTQIPARESRQIRAKSVDRGNGHAKSDAK